MLTGLKGSLFFRVLSFLIALFALRPSYAVPTLSVTAPNADAGKPFERTHKFDSRIELGSQHFQTALSDETLQSYLGFGFRYFSELNQNIQLELSPFLFARSGYVQSDLYDPSNSNALISIEQAALRFHTQNQILFSDIGIIQASRYTSPLLLSRLGSTGLVVGASYPLANEDSSIQFSQQLNIPNSFQQNYTFDEQAEVPNLYISNLSLKHQTPKWGIQSHLGFFQARNLSESLAENSNARGNSIVFASDSRRTRFVFNYTVIETHFNAFVYFNKSNKLGLAVTHIQNMLAPEGLNKGFLIEPKVNFLIGSNQFKVGYQYFHIQPDATIASLNSPMFETNRTGQRLTIGISPDKINTFTLRLAERNVVFTHPFQQHEFLTSLEWETRYDIL